MSDQISQSNWKLNTDIKEKLKDYGLIDARRSNGLAPIYSS